MAIKVIVELQAKPGRRDDLKRALEGLIATQGPGQDGFLGSTRYGVPDNPDVLVEIADWESAEARRARAGSRGSRRVRTAARAAHAVEDVERWLKGRAERAASLPGATGVTDLVAMDGSNHAGVAFEFEDLDALNAVLSSVPPEMAAQAESHGVIMPMTAYVEASGGGYLASAQSLGRQRPRQPAAAITGAVPGPGDASGTSGHGPADGTVKEG